MAKKLLCIVLSVAMLLGMFAVAVSAGNCYDYTREEAEALIAEQDWYVDYEEDVDWKDEIDRRWLTGTKEYDGSSPVAAPQDVLEYNLFFWADEIIEAYNSAASNEDYWNLYNKMATPEILDYTYVDGDETVTECDILYDYAYEYREESKAVFELDLQTDAEYVKAGDVVTVEGYATSNFLTSVVRGGFYYDKASLDPISFDFNTELDPGWIYLGTTFDQGITKDEDGNVTNDRRDDYWPADMYTPENLEKYGILGFAFSSDQSKNVGTYNHARQFENELVFTATFEVKADVADGAEIEFFLPEGCVSTVDDLGASEYGDGEDAATWSFVRCDYVGLTKDTIDRQADYNSFCDQTVVVNPVKLIAGEEPAPAVKGEIVDVYLSEAYVGDVTEVDIEVTGSPEALHFMEADGGYKRVARETATIIEFNGNELWTVDLFVADELLEYTVYADYGELGSTDGKEFVIVGQLRKDLSIHSIEIPDMYPDAQNGGMIVAGKHDIIIKTSTDVVKIQFYTEDGTTYTYTSWSGAGKMPYEDIDGERVWTISHAFGPFGYQSLVIRTRAESTFFTSTGSTLDATVVY